MEGAKLSIATIAAKNIRMNGWLLLGIYKMPQALVIYDLIL